jgi:DeoR/GlpR family transcriptional regulator of sugar metabolism
VLAKSTQSNNKVQKIQKTSRLMLKRVAFLKITCYRYTNLKGAKMLAEERRQNILNLIQLNGSARTAELAKMFNVSDQTIRRDLQELEDQGYLSKSHGGGVLINWSGASFRDRADANREEKLAIAEEAVRYVRPGMTIGVGPGTTTETIAHRLNGMPIKLITNSLAVARAITKRETEVCLTGGHYRMESELVVGEWTKDNLESLFADVSFIGVSGISQDAGYTVTEADEALVLRQYIRVAKRAIIVSDTSKFDRIAKVSVAPLGAVHTLITDTRASQADLSVLQACGVEVVTVQPLHRQLMNGGGR